MKAESALRIVFMGTPEFAVPSLEALLRAGYPVSAVYTQPDRPKNRGMKLTASPVKACAIRHGIPVCQPLSFKKEPEAVETLRQLQPDLIVVAAFGQILPQAVLDLPRMGCINIHSSLLPKYRGAAPVNWAILRGETETGVTIMRMEPALDAGDILLQGSTAIGPDETAEALLIRLSELGAGLLLRAIPLLVDGTACFRSQDPAEVTWAPRLGRELSPMDWTRSAAELHDQVRGLLPWPAATAELGGRTFKIYRTAKSGECTTLEPGMVLADPARGIRVACGDGTLLDVLELQAPGKKRMSSTDYLRGHPNLI